MAYSRQLMSQIEKWLDAGAIPFPKHRERIVELGDQALNADMPHDAVISFIRKFRPDFDQAEIAGGLPSNTFGVVYACELGTGAASSTCPTTLLRRPTVRSSI